MRAHLLCGCALLLVAPPASATTYHVAPDSSGDVLNIQAAIDAAASGDEIVLSDGTFTGDGNWDLNLGSKELVVRSLNGYEHTVIDGGFDYYNEIHHRAFIVEGGQTALTRIEGITIELCRAVTEDGAMMRCGDSSPTIRAVRFRNNTAWARGGIFVHGGSPVIKDCVFEPNLYGGGEGSAIYGEQSWLTIQGCSFSGIDAHSVVSMGGGGELEDCVFVGNSGTYESQGYCVRVAGGPVSLERCTFRHTFGFSVSISSSAQAMIGSCTFEQNTGDDSPAVSVSNSSLVIRNTSFRNNLSGLWGGALTANGSANSLTLDHCLFVGNTNYWPGGASAVSIYGGDLTALHCTFVANRNEQSYLGPAIGVWGGTDVLIENSIIAFGGQSGVADGAVHCDGTPSSLVVRCSDFFGNAGGDWVGCVAGMETSNGNLAVDPLFCDWPHGDVSLQGDSPCAPAHSGECGLIGAQGPWCGPLAVEPRSWGSIKALYR